MMRSTYVSLGLAASVYLTGCASHLRDSAWEKERKVASSSELSFSIKPATKSIEILDSGGNLVFRTAGSVAGLDTFKTGLDFEGSDQIHVTQNPDSTAVTGNGLRDGIYELRVGFGERDKRGSTKLFTVEQGRLNAKGLSRTGNGSGDFEIAGSRD